MNHQTVGLRWLQDRPRYAALGAEQGTGKTWMLLADAELRHIDNTIDALFVIAPKGVHTNWIRREAPKHVSIPWRGAFWLSSAGAKHRAVVDSMLTGSEDLTIVAMNVDAVNTKSGYEYASRFLRIHRTMLVIDESQRIKNPSAKRTKRVMALKDLAVSRRISSGTLVSNSPLDLFSQFEFLDPGLLGTTSYRAFVSEYAELLPPNHPLMQSIKANARAGNPQVVKRDRAGQPVYRNLNKLHALIAPHMYRVLKDECLDLPEKVYQTIDFDLDPAQRKLYDQIKKDMRFERGDGDVDTFTAMTLITKLRQITSGFILVDGHATELVNGAPRLQLLKDVIADNDGPFIVWATFREEISQIATELAPHGVVQYHGGISPKDREEAIEAFQDGSAKVFLANPAAAGVGLTLTAAKTVIYYSSSYSLEERIQSEDRAHRIGTRHPVLYIDLVARDTIDEKISSALQAKAGIAAQILNDELG